MDTILNKEQYLHRMRNMLPDLKVTDDKMDFNSKCIADAFIVSEELSIDCYKNLDSLPQTDIILDLKDSMLNLVCLSRFMGIAFMVLLGDEDD